MPIFEDEEKFIGSSGSGTVIAEKHLHNIFKSINFLELAWKAVTIALLNVIPALHFIPLRSMPVPIRFMNNRLCAELSLQGVIPSVDRQVAIANFYSFF